MAPYEKEQKKSLLKRVLSYFFALCILTFVCVFVLISYFGFKINPPAMFELYFMLFIFLALLFCIVCLFIGKNFHFNFRYEDIFCNTFFALLLVIFLAIAVSKVKRGEHYDAFRGFLVSGMLTFYLASRIKDQILTALKWWVDFCKGE